MAEVKLNTTSSITDYLKSVGKASDFGSRTSLYKESGLEERLGKYVGSVSQNTAFLKSLSTKTAPTATNAAAPITPTAPAPLTGDVRTPSGAIVNAESGSLVTAPDGTTPEKPIGDTGLTRGQITESIPQAPSADEVLQTVLNSPGFQNFQQQQDLSKTLNIGGAQSQKAALEAKTAKDTKDFITSIGRRGLFFSGETTTGLQALAESLASSKFDVDRKLAGDLLQSDLTTREKIIDQVGKVVADAQKGRKEAIDALEKVGLTVIGNEIVPTLAARNAELAAEREERITGNAERSAELAREREERLQKQAEYTVAATERRIQLAEEAAVRAERRLEIAEDNANRYPKGSIVSGNAVFTPDSITTTSRRLNEARGEDTWTDPNLYWAAYNEWVNVHGGTIEDFAASFPPKYYVNPSYDTDASPLGKALPIALQNKPDAVNPY